MQLRAIRHITARSLSGAPIEVWNRPVRLVYLDEAGISNPSQEPYLVVGGIIINADQDWRPLERHLQSITRKHIPSDERHGLIFHASDIFHGSGYFERSRFPREVRNNILQDLANIPSHFHLPIVYSGINRKLMSELYPNDSKSIISDAEIANSAYMEAFIRVVADVDLWMLRNAPAEVAMLVAEDTGKVKRAIKMLHSGYTGEVWEDDGKAFTTHNIVDTVHFAAKDESALLQIADMRVFVIKRTLMLREDINPFFRALRSQIISPLADLDNVELQVTARTSDLRLVKPE